MVQQNKERRAQKTPPSGTNGTSPVQETPNHTNTPCEPWQGILLLLLYVLLVVYSINEMLYVPPPEPLDAPVGMFSEARAMQHVKALTQDIGERQVSTPGVEAAAQYLMQQLQDLQDNPHTRKDVKLEILREQASGAVNFNFLGTNITNAYQNLTNVMARVTPLNSRSQWAFLVNAHYDSTMGTTGASDCASCVGIGLETLRAIMMNQSIPLFGPVVFLFNGGEETLMQAAHGFMNSSVWQHNVGAFINLESTGPRGLPILFQHTGAWTASVYAKTAKMPRGTSLSQDFFESRAIPGDTDFKMLSATYQGRLPGLDVAYVLGGSMYHTAEDKVENIRPGTLQEMGDNMMGLVPGFTAEMARMSNGTSRESRETAAYYFPVFGSMVVYPKSMGTLLHNAPLLMLLTMPGQIKTVVREANVQLTYGGIIGGMLLYALSVVCGILLPAVGAAFRALALGKPLIFFAHHELGYVMYMPLALIGLLLPISLSNCDLPSAIFGSAWLWGLGGFFATKHQLGAAIYPFLWIAPVHLAYTLTVKKSQFWQLFALLVSTFVPSFVSITSMYTMTEHIMDKINLAGSFSGLLGRVFADSVVGIVQGLAVIISLGLLAPAAAVATKPIRKGVLLTLLAISASAALYGSVSLKPYDVTHPKRVFCQHLHVVDTHKQYLFPLGKLLQGVVIPAPRPPEGHLGGHVPDIKELGRGAPEGAAANIPGAKRIQLLIDTRSPCWGMLNITGPKLLAWSLTDSVPSIPLAGPPAAAPPGAPKQVMHFVRFAGNAGSEQWRVWLDVQGNEPLRIELTAKYYDLNDEVVAFGKQFPDWVAYTGLLVYHVDWEAPV